MHKRIWVAILLAAFLTGCATTKKGQDIQLQQLQGRISSLEAELQKKEQEISNLEAELNMGQGSSSRKITGGPDTQVTQLSIRQIQKALRNAGLYKGTIDGKMGSQTTQSIREFQKANGLKADGIVGKRTADKLSSYLLE